MNTIIAGNRGFVRDCATSGYVFSLGHNIDGDGSCMLSEPTDQPGSSTALLGSLQHNGGPTPTHELLPGSSGIDTGAPSWCPGIDQRNFPRPYGARCDVGAYEAGWKLTPERATDPSREAPRQRMRATTSPTPYFAGVLDAVSGRRDVR